MAEQVAAPRPLGKSTVRICFEPEILQVTMQSINSVLQATQTREREQNEELVRSRREILESATALSHDWLLLLEHFRASKEDAPAFAKIVRQIEDFQNAASTQLEVGFQV